MKEKGKLTKPVISAVQCRQTDIYASVEPQYYYFIHRDQ